MKCVEARLVGRLVRQDGVPLMAVRRMRWLCHIARATTSALFDGCCARWRIVGGRGAGVVEERNKGLARRPFC